jgi:hypothetical protein
MYTDHGATFNVDAQRAYTDGIVIIPRATFDWLVFVGMWRTRDSDGDSQQKKFVLYAKSTDLTRWFAMDGTLHQYTTSFDPAHLDRPSDYGSATPSMPVTWFNFSAGLVSGLPPVISQGSFGIFMDPLTVTDSTPGNIAIRVFNGDSLGGNTVPGTTQAAQPWLWYTWNGSTWVRTDAYSAPGNERDFYIDGAFYTRVNTTIGVMRRASLRQNQSGKLHSLGLSFPNTDVYSPTPCPVWLREGVYLTSVPVDNTPKLCRFPSGVGQ